MDAPYRHIACCLDDSDAARLALDEARRLRALGPGRLSLVHVVHWPLPYSGGPVGMWAPNLEDVKSSARIWLDEQVAAVPEAQGVLLVGYAPAVAREWAKDNAADLLVVAAYHGFAERIALGSFAHYLVQHAPCPVLVLRPPPES